MIFCKGVPDWVSADCRVTLLLLTSLTPGYQVKNDDCEGFGPSFIRPMPAFFTNALHTTSQNIFRYLKFATVKQHVSHMYDASTLWKPDLSSDFSCILYLHQPNRKKVHVQCTNKKKSVKVWCTCMLKAIKIFLDAWCGEERWEGIIELVKLKKSLDGNKFSIQPRFFPRSFLNMTGLQRLVLLTELSGTDVAAKAHSYVQVYFLFFEWKIIASLEDLSHTMHTSLSTCFLQTGY